MASFVFEGGDARTREAEGERSDPSDEECARQGGEGANLDEINAGGVGERDPEGAQAA